MVLAEDAVFPSRRGGQYRKRGKFLLKEEAISSWRRGEVALEEGRDWLSKGGGRLSLERGGLVLKEEAGYCSRRTRFVLSERGSWSSDREEGEISSQGGYASSPERGKVGP